ncbi:CoA transferase [Streptomyces nigrescens]
MPQPHRPQPRPPADADPDPTGTEPPGTGPTGTGPTGTGHTGTGHTGTGSTDATPPGAPPARALDGILVADFSRVPAGPPAAATLADLGAEVIKVERPGSGDDTRAWGPPFVAQSAVVAAGLAGQSGVRTSGHRPRSGPNGQSPSEHRPVRDAGLPRWAAARGGGGQ